MKMLARIALVGTLLVLQQVLAPYTGLAQVDPCEPVPIPDLCEDIVEPTPSPTNTPDNRGKGDGKGGGGGGNRPGGGGGGGGKDRTGSELGDAGQAGKTSPGKKAVTAGKTSDEEIPFVLGGPKNTKHLVDVLKKLDRYGVPVKASILDVVGPFPVAGLSWWANDWHAPRCCPFPHVHEGLDMFAEEGTPLVAAADGVISQKVNDADAAGLGLEITDDAGVQYFYAHLSKIENGISVGTKVHVGQVIGEVGNTGNAVGTSPHLHFEVQPGGVPVPPKPYVDKWLKLSESRAEALVARVTGEPLQVGSDFRLTRLFDLSGGAGATEDGAERLLALATVQPPVSSLGLVRRMLGQMAWEIDWGGQVNAKLARLAERYTRAASARDLAEATPWAPIGAPTVAQVTGQRLQIGD